MSARNPDSSARLLPENLLQATYPDMKLPPLWQVIYQEAVRGHHLVFRPTDVAMFDKLASGAKDVEPWLDQSLTEDLEDVVVQLASCSDLSSMVKIVDSLPINARCALYFLYRRLLWTWRHQLKEQLN